MGCGLVDCEPYIKGACCLADRCVYLTQGDCTDSGGLDFYAGKTCEDEGVECPSFTGVCCRSGGECENNVSAAFCEGEGERHFPGYACTPDLCDSDIIIVDTLNGPEGLTEIPERPEGGQYYEFEDVGIKIAFAGGSFNIHNLGTGVALFQDIGTSPYYGVFPMMRHSGVDDMLAFGPNGLDRFMFDAGESRFLDPENYPIGNVTDACRPPGPVGGLDYDGHFIAVSYSERDVVMYAWSTGLDAWEGTQTNAGFFTYEDESPTDHTAISAWSAFDGFFIAALTLEPTADSNFAGELWYGDYASEFTHSSSVFVGEVGVNPRRVRCLAGVCAVSSWRDGYLTLASWPDTSEPPALTGWQRVGDGPVGIDLIEDGSNILVVSTGYNDNTYTITTVASDATVVSSGTLYAPAGCTGPGHAIWIEDGGTRKVVLSCNTSSNFAVFDPSDV
ncbi:MAG: hypothetical protein ABIJ56_06885 [Pseudomonadota bacterium]